jgi:hypothetical protein
VNSIKNDIYVFNDTVPVCYVLEIILTLLAGNLFITGSVTVGEKRQSCLMILSSAMISFYYSLRCDQKGQVL